MFLKDRWINKSSAAEVHMQSLTIDEILFLQAFARDLSFHDDYPQFRFLDLKSGDILSFYDSDEQAEISAGISAEENAELRQPVADNPDGYLEIPGLEHGDHHDILKEFLASDWTDNENLKSWAESAYLGSIGRWKKKVDDDSAVSAYYNFRDRKTTQMAEDYLRSHGIEPQWK
jgi:hypothetical protein